MPFLRDGGAGGSALPASATMQVSLESVVALKKELEDIRYEVLKFAGSTTLLTGVNPPGADPVSTDAANLFTENVGSANNAVGGFIEELTRVIDALDQTARDYGLTEDSIKTDLRAER